MPGMPKYISQKEAPGDRERYGEDGRSQDGDHGVLEHVLKEDAPLAHALGHGRPHVVRPDLVEHDRPVEPQAPAQARRYREDNGQEDEFPCTKAEFVAVDGEILEDHSQEILAHDDVIEYDDAHEDDADEERHPVDVGAPVIGDEEGAAAGWR